MKYSCPGYPVSEVGHPELRPFPHMLVLLKAYPFFGENQDGLDHAFLKPSHPNISILDTGYLARGSLYGCFPCMMVSAIIAHLQVPRDNGSILFYVILL